MIVSETYSLEDIYKYVSGTDTTAISNNISAYSLAPQGAVTPTISTDGTNISITTPNSSNGYQRADLSFLDNLNNFKMSMIVNTPSAFGFQLNNGNYLYLFTSESRWIVTKTNVNGDWNTSYVYQSLESTKEYTLEMTVNGSSVSLKIYNDTGTEIASTSKTMSAQMTRFGFSLTKNATFKFRDLKVRQL